MSSPSVNVSYCELCGVQMESTVFAVCDVCWAQQHDDPDGAYDAWLEHSEREYSRTHRTAWTDDDTPYVVHADG